MIAITTENGRLHIFVDMAIPNAPGGQWDQVRMGLLLTHIVRTVVTAEMVDEAASQIDRALLPPRKPNFKSGLVVVPPSDL